jgi:hypothetical protein
MRAALPGLIAMLVPVRVALRERTRIRPGAERSES